MNKLQVASDYHEPLYPITHDDMMTDFSVVKRYGENTLKLLPDVWFNQRRLENNPSYQLLRLLARPVLAEHEDFTAPYRAGVIVGTRVVVARLQRIHESPDEVAMALSFAKDKIAWRGLQKQRFALRQFFDTDVDVKQQLHDTVEKEWQDKHVRFLPDANAPIDDPNWPANDWVAVGMGDALRLYERRYAQYVGEPLRQSQTIDLQPEPRLPELWTT